MGCLHAVVAVSLPSHCFLVISIHSLVSHSPTDGHLSCFQVKANMNKAAMNIPEVVLCRYMHSFLLDTFLSVGLLGHEMCSCFILLDLGGFFQTHLETSLVLSPTLSALLPPKVSPFCFCDQACFLTCMFLSTGQKEGATPPQSTCARLRARSLSLSNKSLNLQIFATENHIHTSLHI